jgi:mRNA interferase RelE/StbE
MSNYRLRFHKEALDEWERLDNSVKQMLKARLGERLRHPEIEQARLNGSLQNCYKIKLAKAGIRLVYKVEATELVVLVLAIGRRENETAYKKAAQRLS